MSRLFPLAALLAVALRGAEIVDHPFPGVTHIVRTESLPRQVTLHILQIDLATPGLRFKVTPRAGSRETVRQTTLEFLKQERAQIAINLHFFVPFPSADTEAYLVGLAASDGNVYSNFENPEQSYAIVANAPAINLDRQNRASLITPQTASGAELWNAFAGSARIITDGVLSVPVYRDEGHPDAELTPGGPASYSNAKSWYGLPNARTIAGLSRDNNTLFLITVDKGLGSQGLSLHEAAEFLVREYQIYNALNLDGGGSTTLAMEDPHSHTRTLTNVPSAAGKARLVASSLAVFVPLDATPPITISSLSEGMDADETYPTNLTVELLAADNAGGTGVRHTFYSLEGEKPALLLLNTRERTVIQFPTPGSYELVFFAKDFAGNQEAPHSIRLRIRP